MVPKTANMAAYVPDQNTDPIAKKEAESMHAQQATIERNYEMVEPVSAHAPINDINLNMPKMQTANLTLMFEKSDQR